MSAWLDPLRAALDAAPAPVGLFFRDDDAGWADGRLDALLARFERHDAPLDLAVIPATLGAALAARLLAWREARPGRLGLHQHGYAHANHEAAGRKCEFGPSRSAAAQAADLEAGAQRMAAWLGAAAERIFTPPWNRCTAVTATALAARGFLALSRDAGAAPLATAGLAELPVAVDWCKRGAGVAPSPCALARRIAAAIGGCAPVGIMLHHAVMDDAELDRLDELLGLVVGHPACRCRRMAEWLGGDA